MSESKEQTVKVTEEGMRKERVEKCVKEVSRILEEYNCHIMPSLLVTNEGNEFKISIVSR